MRSYDHKRIEKKWQDFWNKNSIYTTSDQVPGKDNFYLLVEFPYPSGNLHVGHWYAFAVPDILARMMRMQGKNVMYPIGFDAFGLPAENAAIKNKLNPRDWTEQNIAHMTKQIESMGTSFDWSRKVSTIDPEYYKWTQWLFLQLFKKDLVYQKETDVNWCPKDKTVLANEQVVDGKCERCDSEVVQRKMLQWNVKITEYADRLIDDLAALDWPEQIKESQRNWIGRSEGAEIDFPLDLGKKYKIVYLHGFESRPDRPRHLWYKAELERMGYKVIMPALPNPDAPSEEEQVEAALRATTYDEHTVLVGHSLGSVVAMKVLERLDTPIARFVTVGGFCNRNFKDKPRSFDKKFNWVFDGEKIRRNARSITVLHDPRDHAISNAQAKELSDLLQTPVTLGKSNEPHFTGDTEPDVLMWLRPTIRVFSTRADTLYGATYLVLAPEHPLLRQGFGGQAWVRELKNCEEIERYIATSRKKTERERQIEQKEKTGVELKGVTAINPATGKKMPVWVADFVIGSYGTGAVFADAHDQRDWEFAKKHNIPLKETLEPLVIRKSGMDTYREGEPFVERHAVIAIVKHSSENKYLCLQYKLRDLRYFVCGGIEEGEDPAETGIREIREEAGYTNVRFVRRLGTTIHSRFFQPEKQKNTSGHFIPLLYELVDESREEIAEREKALHESIWIGGDKVDEYINSADVQIAWSRVKGETCYAGKGILFDSGEFSGLESDEAILKIGAKYGRLVKQFHLRDWIVSRQRYWGVPIPIIHCEKCGPVAVPDKDLPVELPDVKDYLPDGRGKSPLAKVKAFVNAACPECGGKAERETDTLDTFVDSSWYFLRYADPNNEKEFAAREKQDAWMPVDLYSGGAEHTTMHLLYSRFWHKALFDIGLTRDSEPYVKRESHGLVLGPDGQKMSKSRGNVLDPDEMVERLGADTVRLYLAFMGPYTGGVSYPWSPDAIAGMRRFLERVWRAQACVGLSEVAALETVLNQTIKKVGEDVAVMKFNTAISTLMIFLNATEKATAIGPTQWRVFLRLLAPFAPHVCDELWSGLGYASSIHQEDWPVFDPEKLKEDTITIAIQINGKTRGEVVVAMDADKETLENSARQAIVARLAGKSIKRAVVVLGRLVNFVVEE